MLLYPFLTPGGLDSTLRYLPVIGQGVLRFAFIPAQLFPRGPCIWRKAHSEHLSSRPLIKFRGRWKYAGGWLVGIKILGLEAASSLRTQARTFFPGQGRATR
jgi:hypothetical protein